MENKVLVDKNTREVKTCVIRSDKDIEEFAEDYNYDLRSLDVMNGEDIDVNIKDLTNNHKVYQDGSIKDAREIVSYRATLEDIIEVKGKQFSKDTKTFNVDDREQAEELANKLNMEITDFEEIKKLPKT